MKILLFILLAPALYAQTTRYDSLFFQPPNGSYCEAGSNRYIHSPLIPEGVVSRFADPRAMAS